MTPFGASVARELKSALVPIETVSIADYRYLASSIRALLNNALFYVVPAPPIDAARAETQAKSEALAEAIHAVGVQPQGVSLTVDQARADAIVAMQGLIDAVADAEPTPAARALGIG